MNSAKRQQKLAILIVCFVIAFAAVFLGIRLTSGSESEEKAAAGTPASASDSSEVLSELLSEIDIRTAETIKASVDPSEVSSLADELPELEDSSYVVRGTGEVDLVIFSSPEKAGEEQDSWLIQLAEDFNSAGYTTSSGQSMSVTVVNVTSGLAADYITSGKYVPDLFTPSSSLWGSMVQAQDVELELLMETTVKNTAGILVRNSMYEDLFDQYGTINMKTIVEATAAGELVTGYTNPYTSSTGLNFLVSTLANYDSNDILSEKAVSGFSSFQKNVPYVAYNTQQMSKAAARGTFDAFILESQQYENSADLKKDYRFVPFGYTHDNPLYTVGTLSAEKQEAAAKLREVLGSDQAKSLAAQNGFGTMDYTSEMEDQTGTTLIQAQKLWKSEKDSGKTIAAVFVADVSGSMYGDPLNSLKESLINSMQYISENNYVGLISYSDSVTIHMAPEQFNLNAKSSFKGAVQSMDASGNTASYSALAVAMNQLDTFIRENPDLDIRPMIFLLSDGETNTGLGFSDVKPLLEDMKYPVYTIGYNTSLDALQRISEINEAACIDANSDDIIYNLKNLFNANL